jgi:hypothetical protein
MEASMRHPFGIVVLVTSIGLAAAILFKLALEEWNDWRVWLLFVWGGAFYFASVVAVLRTRPTPAEPEIRQLDSVRRMLNAIIKQRKSSEGWSRSSATRALEDAYEHLDRRIMPAMAELLTLRDHMAESLKSFEDGSLPPPQPHVLARLRRIHARQQATIDECIQQAADAAATLIALLQEREGAAVTDIPDSWVEDIVKTYEAIVETIQTTVKDVEPEPAAVVTRKPTGELELHVVINALQTALRRLNRPPTLADCELNDLLSCTIAGRCKHANPNSPVATPLESAQALHSILIEEIEMLRPADYGIGGSNRAAELYTILHEQYVLRRSVVQIRMRLHLAEKTYFVRRLEAINAIAHDLVRREQAAATQNAAV